MQSICGELQNPRGWSSQFGAPSRRADEYFTQLDSAVVPIWEPCDHREFGRL